MSGRNGGHKLSAIEAGMPRKRFYRQRAHANPLSIHHLDYPSSPAVLQWPTHYPASVDSPTILDIGCGFGGLLISLAPLYPATNLLGIEIRTQVTQYVQDKIRALRVNPDSKDADDVVPEAIDPRLLPDAGYHYENVSVLRGNAMKYLPNFFPKASINKLFFLFPDPHFKIRKHKARIISTTLLAEYAYLLPPGGHLYTITDVPSLHLWMVSHLDPFPLFRRLSQLEIDSMGLPAGGQPTEQEMLNNLREREVMKAVKTRTEEGMKVERNGVGKEWSVWVRLHDHESCTTGGGW